MEGIGFCCFLLKEFNKPVLLDVIQFVYCLHCNQRHVLLLHLFARVLSNREIPYQALISNHKTSNKENYKIGKVKEVKKLIHKSLFFHLLIVLKNQWAETA